MPKPPVCLTCGGAVVNGNLYCSKACGEGKVSHRAARQMLVERGFDATETSNVYLKDGVAITLEAVSHVGLAEAIKRHEHAAAIHAEAGRA